MIASHILQNLNELRQKNKYCDLQLLSDDGTAFSLHKCVFVSSCKKHFDIACSKENELHMAKMSKMILPDICSDELRLLISFIYGENRTDQNSKILEKALSKLHMLDLLDFEDSVTKTNQQDIQAPVKTEAITQTDKENCYQVCNLTIKEEPKSPTDQSIVVEVQVLENDENSSNHKSTEGKVEKTVNIPKTKEPSAIDSIVTCELKKLKLECEELANCEGSLHEIKTEEDAAIEKLMDQISEEIELLESPPSRHSSKVTEGRKTVDTETNPFEETCRISDQLNSLKGIECGDGCNSDPLNPKRVSCIIPEKNELPQDQDLKQDSSKIIEDIHITKNRPLEITRTVALSPLDCHKETINAKQLFPYTGDNSQQSVSLYKSSTHYKTAVSKDNSVSPVKHISTESLKSPECQTRVTPQCKYKMILPRVSAPSEIQAMTVMPPPASKVGRRKKSSNTMLIGKRPYRRKIKVSNPIEQFEVVHKTIATLLALPAQILNDMDKSSPHLGENNEIKSTSTKMNETATRSEPRQIKCVYFDKDNECYRVLEQKDQTPSSDQAEVSSCKKIPQRASYQQGEKLHEQMKAANKNNRAHEAAQNNIDLATRPESRQIKCYIDKDNECYRVLEQNDQTPSSDQEVEKLAVDERAADRQEFSVKLTLSEQIEMQRKRRRKSSKPMKREINKKSHPVLGNESFEKIQELISENLCGYYLSLDNNSDDNCNSSLTEHMKKSIDGAPTNNTNDAAGKLNETDERNENSESNKECDSHKFDDSHKNVAEKGSINSDNSKKTENCSLFPVEAVNNQIKVEAANAGQTILESTDTIPRKEQPSGLTTNINSIESPVIGTSIAANLPIVNHGLPNTKQNRSPVLNVSPRSTRSISIVSPEIVKLLKKKVDIKRIESSKFQGINEKPAEKNGMNIQSISNPVKQVSEKRPIITNVPDLVNTGTTGHTNSLQNTGPTVVTKSVKDSSVITQINEIKQTEGSGSSSSKRSRMKSQLSVNKLLHIKPKLPTHVDVTIGSPLTLCGSRKRSLSMPEGSHIESLKKSKRVTMKVKPRYNKNLHKLNKKTTFNPGNVLYYGSQESHTFPAVSVTNTSCHSNETVASSATVTNSLTGSKETSECTNDKQIDNTTKQAMPVILMNPKEDTLHGVLRCYEKPLQFTLEQPVSSNKLEYIRPMVLQPGKCTVPVNDSGTIGSSAIQNSSVIQNTPSILNTSAIQNTPSIGKRAKSYKPATVTSYRPIAPKREQKVTYLI